MGYCFWGIEKIKSTEALISKYTYNYKTVEVKNASNELKEFNEALVKLVDESRKPCTYVDAFKQRINSLEYYKNHKYRKDAVLGFEVITTFSSDDNIDINMLKEKNVEWLNKTFNIAPNDKPKCKMFMYHADAVEVIYIAIAMPMLSKSMT